jgi:hypothetical protein
MDRGSEKSGEREIFARSANDVILIFNEIPLSPIFVRIPCPSRIVNFAEKTLGNTM